MGLGSQSGKSVATAPPEARLVDSENTAVSTVILTFLSAVTGKTFLSFPNFKRDCSQLVLNSGLIFPSSPSETCSFLKINVSKNSIVCCFLLLLFYFAKFKLWNVLLTWIYLIMSVVFLDFLCVLESSPNGHISQTLPHLRSRENWGRRGRLL